MAAARFHSGDSRHSRCRAEPYIPGLLFKSRMENIGQCAGIGHSNPATVRTATVTTETATTVTAKMVIAVTAMVSTAARETQVPIFFVLERRKLERPGFIGN